jgi:tetratricopeptide (TPR) repeat protein
VAEIDAAEGRPEAGLSILTTTESAVLAGALGGALLAAAGDREGAKEALTRAGETETFAPLGALCLARAASLTDHPGERAELLRGALSRAPTVEALRWPRLAVLLELGDERAAQAEAEGVSAIAPVGRRFEVALRLGKTFLDRGHAAAARLWFERALLFSPRSPEAMVGLGEAMLEGQCFGRATEVLSRASEGLEREGKPRGRALLALARALADGSEELSLAIARVRAVKSDESVAVEARYREGTWLARLGDRAEASLAFLRMLEAEERTPHGSPEHAAAWLAEAARFEREERGDLAIAKRHLGVAIRLRPKDPSLLAEFRRAARELEAARTFVPRTPEREPPPSRRDATPRAPLAAPVRRPLELDLSPDESDAEDEEGADDAALVEKLTDRLRGDPTNLEISLELAAALERLGRDLDLLGVLSAQIDEGDEETRALFLPLRRSTLERLARNARAEGREGEAQLYASMAKG